MLKASLFSSFVDFMGLKGPEPPRTTLQGMVNVSSLTARFITCCAPFQPLESVIGILVYHRYCMRITAFPTSQLGSHPSSLCLVVRQGSQLIFFFWRVQDPVGGTVNDWVREHQTWLHLAFEGVRDRLRVAVERLKRNHDRTIRSEPPVEGQMVLL